MSKQLQKMNKHELINLAVSYGVIEQAEKLAIDNKRKDGPTNKDYLVVLEPFKEKINGKTEEPIIETPKADEVKSTMVHDDSDITNAKPLSGAELNEARATDLFRSIPVIVIDHDNSQDIENDITGRGEQFGWGNPIIGMQKETVFKHGRMQYLYIGTIKHIKTITIREKSDKKGVADIVIPRFTITEVPDQGFTQEKIDSLRAKQVIQG